MATPPPPAKPSDLGQRMITSSIAIMAIVGVIVYFLYTGAVELDEPVQLTVVAAVPDAATADKPIAVDLALTLENGGKEGIALTAPTACEVFRWFLTDTENEFVQSQADAEVCAQVTVSTYLDGRHAMKETFPIKLDPARVKPGEYRIHVRYWGYETEAPVVVR